MIQALRGSTIKLNCVTSADPENVLDEQVGGKLDNGPRPDPRLGPGPEEQVGGEIDNGLGPGECLL